MTTLSNLEALVRAAQATQAPYIQLARAQQEWILAANPATILAMIELIRLQHEVLKNVAPLLEIAFNHEEDVFGISHNNAVDVSGELDTAIEAFKKWEGE